MKARAAVLAAIALSGCGSGLPPEGTLRVDVGGSKPSSQLRPHSGYSNATLNLSYAGPRKWLAWGVEAWKEGKPSPVDTWKRYGYSHPRQVLSFSIQDENFQGKPPACGILMELKYESGFGGSEKAGGGLTWPSPSLARAWTLSLPGGSLEFPGEQEKAVWGLFQHSGVLEAREGGSLEELAGRAEWAVLLKVRMED
jgi:hypothetical protein